jgi:histidyl-tRNA synthetase
MAFDAAGHRYAFKALGQLRAAGLNADLYPNPGKLNKQMKYANDRQVPYIILVGDEEMASGKLALKNMQSGEQESLSVAEIIEKLI